MPKQVFHCPDCRNRSIRRRKRSNVSLYVASLFGRWPYHCEECGSDFLLTKRYIRPLDTEGHVMRSATSQTVENSDAPEAGP